MRQRRHSADYGGGICCDGASPTITNTLIRENDSEIDGGGIYLGKSPGTIVDGALIEESYIEMNQASSGAGIALASLSDDEHVPMIVNCILWRNQTPEVPPRHIGGAVYCHESYLTLLHSTLGRGRVRGVIRTPRQSSSESVVFLSVVVSDQQSVTTRTENESGR